MARASYERFTHGSISSSLTLIEIILQEGISIQKTVPNCNCMSQYKFAIAQTEIDLTVVRRALISSGLSNVTAETGFNSLLTQVPNVANLIIRMRLVPFLNKTGASALSDLVKQCRSKSIEVIFSALQSQPKSFLSRFHKKQRWDHVDYTGPYKKALILAKEKINGLDMG